MIGTNVYVLQHKRSKMLLSQDNSLVWNPETAIAFEDAFEANSYLSYTVHVGQKELQLVAIPKCLTVHVIPGRSKTGES